MSDKTARHTPRMTAWPDAVSRPSDRPLFQKMPPPTAAPKALTTRAVLSNQRRFGEAGDEAVGVVMRWFRGARARRAQVENVSTQLRLLCPRPPRSSFKGEPGGCIPGNTLVSDCCKMHVALESGVHARRT